MSHRSFLASLDRESGEVTQLIWRGVRFDVLPDGTLVHHETAQSVFQVYGESGGLDGRTVTYKLVDGAIVEIARDELEELFAK